MIVKIHQNANKWLFPQTFFNTFEVTLETNSLHFYSKDFKVLNCICILSSVIFLTGISMSFILIGMIPDTNWTSTISLIQKKDCGNGKSANVVPFFPQCINIYSLVLPTNRQRHKCIILGISDGLYTDKCNKYCT